MLDLPLANGRLIVTPELRVEGSETIWACGDCACIAAGSASAGRKLRIFIEWAWGALFPIDITHLRFTRSRDVMTPSED